MCFVRAWREEPNNLAGQEYCGALLPGGVWSDRNCDDQMNYICRRTLPDGLCSNSLASALYSPTCYTLYIIVSVSASNLSCLLTSTYLSQVLCTFMTHCTLHTCPTYFAYCMLVSPRPSFTCCATVNMLISLTLHILVQICRVWLLTCLSH